MLFLHKRCFHLIFFENRNLRSVCNFLIAFDAFLNVICISGNNLLLTPLIQMYWPTMPLYACFLSQMLFTFAYDLTGSMSLVIGLERFVSVFFPYWLSFCRLTNCKCFDSSKNHKDRTLLNYWIFRLNYKNLQNW